MIERKYLSIVEEKLNNFSAVGLLGLRQIGKTTLAKEIAKRRPSIYLDLENYQDLAKLDAPIKYLEAPSDKLIISGVIFFFANYSFQEQLSMRN